MSNKKNGGPKRLILATTVLLSLAAGTSEAGVVITFDAGDPIGGLGIGSVLSNQYAGEGVVFSPNGFSGPGGPTGNWATNTDMGIVSSSGVDVGGLGTPSLVSGNLLRNSFGWSLENGDPSFLATFASPISSLSADFAGIATPSSTKLFAYSGLTLVSVATASVTTGQQHLTVSSASPITSVIFTPGDFSDWVGVDNISFESIGTVPEPGTTALLAAGLIALRRRRTI